MNLNCKTVLNIIFVNLKIIHVAIDCSGIQK
jgi:hypothetical protein